MSIITKYDSNRSKTRTYSCKVCSVVSFCRYTGKNIYCSRQCAARDLASHKKHQYKTDESIRNKLSKSWVKKGQRLSPDTEYKKGVQNKNWNNGSSFLRQSYGNSKYVQWRNAVLKRDGKVCRICNKDSRKMETDHIKPWALFPALRFNTQNGQVLCRACHIEKSIRDRKIIRLTRSII